MLLVSAEEGTNQESTQEQIFENIRLHKEVIQSVKLQPWHIRKKLKLVRQVSEGGEGEGGCFHVARLSPIKFDFICQFCNTFSPSFRGRSLLF